MRIRIFLAALFAVLVLAPTAAAAGAQQPTPYQGQGGNVQNEVQQGAAGAAQASAGSLPFTGQNLLLVAAAGALLLVAGGVFYRLSRDRS